jgi:hypothetical protein
MKKTAVMLICLCMTVVYASQAKSISKKAEQYGNNHSWHEHQKVTHNHITSVPRTRQVHFFEDFESGMPVDWMVIDENNDGYTWTVGTTDDLWLPPPNYGTAYAYYSDDDAGETAPPGTEYLISPSVECSGLTDLMLSYCWAFTIFDPPIGASYVRFHDGSTWNVWNHLATYYVDGNGIDTFNLTPYLPADSVQVQFTYEDSAGGWGWAFGIDNVLLETPRDHDVGVASIDMAWHIPTDTTFYPEATVKNYGLNNETFDVTCEINPGSYTSMVTVTGLDPGNVQSIIFPDSFTFANGIYAATVYTELIGDENPLNDTMVSEVWATDWQIYDDGSTYGAFAWMDAGNGYGVQFPVTSDWWVDSIACFFDSTWPAPGDTTATFRLYDGVTSPANIRWQLNNATIQRGAWNYFAVDTAQSWFTAGNNVFFIYIQAQPYPNCPGLSFDYAVDYPQHMWQYASGYFSTATTDGDFLMRIHIVSPVGVGEWISMTPNVLIFESPTIVNTKARIAFTIPLATEVELAIYDVTGRKCAALIDDNLPAGDHDRTFDFDLVAGVYFYNLRTQSGIDVTRKFLVIK